MVARGQQLLFLSFQILKSIHLTDFQLLDLGAQNTGREKMEYGPRRRKDTRNSSSNI